MTRRIEAGPVLVGLGALVLLVSIFLDWYEPNVTAWEAFEVLDLALAVLALAALVAAAGALRPDLTLIERRQLPLIVAALVVIVGSQILDPPPSVDGELDTGAWIALGAAAVIAVGTLLTLGRVSFALTVEGRDTRRRVSAVDARTDPTTSDMPAVDPSRTGRTRVMGGDKT
jgi:hypothetical protein